MTSAAQSGVEKPIHINPRKPLIEPRRLVWAGGLGLFSALWIALTPGYGILAMAAMTLSLAGCVWGYASVQLDCGRNLLGTLFGSVLSATLLAASVVLGQDLAGWIGPDHAAGAMLVSVGLGFVLFAGLTVAEATISLGTQAIGHRLFPCDGKIAYQIDLRYGGLAGQLAV